MRPELCTQKVQDLNTHVAELEDEKRDLGSYPGRYGYSNLTQPVKPPTAASGSRRSRKNAFPGVGSVKAPCQRSGARNFPFSRLTSSLENPAQTPTRVRRVIPQPQMWQRRRVFGRDRGGYRTPPQRDDNIGWRSSSSCRKVPAVADQLAPQGRERERMSIQEDRNAGRVSGSEPLDPAVKKVPQRVNKVPQPSKAVPEPREGIPSSAENVSHTVKSVSSPVENASSSVKEVSRPAESVSERPKGVSRPAESVSEPATGVSRPVKDSAPPAKGTTRPQRSVPNPESDAPRPATNVPGRESEASQRTARVRRSSAIVPEPADFESLCPVCGEPLVYEKCKRVCRSERCIYRLVFNCSEY
jgi:hypothetical protein